MEQILYPAWYIETIRRIFTHSKSRRVFKTHPFGCVRVGWTCNCTNGTRQHPAYHLDCYRCNTVSNLHKEPVYDIPKRLYDIMEHALNKEQIIDLLLHHAELPFHYKRFFHKFSVVRLATMRVLFGYDHVQTAEMIQFLCKSDQTIFTSAMQHVDSLLDENRTLTKEDVIVVRGTLLDLRDEIKIKTPSVVMPNPCILITAIRRCPIDPKLIHPVFIQPVIISPCVIGQLAQEWEKLRLL
uniref:Uncharacterized protein n=1 Tax=Clandestinovirus TaxID=2831644 RepID=A0A8F8KSZ0_9VIRU|nr:hypothetical protein KOM_12_241 [Clandestinovirus]